MPHTISDKDFAVIQDALSRSNTLAATTGNKTYAERDTVTEATHDALSRLAAVCPQCPPPSPPPVKNPTS